MPKISDVRELFVSELQDILYAERMIAKMLPQLAQEATNPELSKRFREHLEETRQHVANLEQVFEQVGQKAKAKPCPSIEGIRQEHDEFMQEESPTPEICDLFLTGAAARTEHYEIAAYTGLLSMARALGETQAADLLKQNLEQEKATLKKVETIGNRLGKQEAKRLANV